MSASTFTFLISIVILVVCLPDAGVYAFGAGNIPSFAYMEGRAFRHGDLEDTLSELAKKTGGFALGALIGKGGSKFGGLDIKRVYFGNWLRDYSQAVDITTLKKVPLQTIINLCMVLGFLAHGYATNEFEVTVERLGAYLPAEHIDNPKGYGDGEDARRFDPRLRGPVDPRELEVDPRTGMKNYIANEVGPWDTSKALVRRTLERCIHIGRLHRAQGRKEDEYEAYRLLGQALHTLEDFPAHSNFCELALVSMDHSNVFVHVGDYVRIQAPNGRWVAPLVTGTFGSSDFLHSLLGEATDHLSEASVSDLNRAVASARSRSASGGRSPADTLRDLLFRLPDGSGTEITRDMDGIERIREAPIHGGKPPEQMSPQELHSVFWQVLSFRDSVVKKIALVLENIPGLASLIEKITDSISVFALTTLEPYLKPILQSSSTQLMAASNEVIDSRDQYEVFNNPEASDPTHSFLSKDHFNLILNEPAGNIAKIIVRHTVTAVIKAWDDNTVNVKSVTDEVLQCLFHPEFQNHSSQIQREMLAGMRLWLQSLGHKQSETFGRLTKQAVHGHQNVRPGSEGSASMSQGTFSANAGGRREGDGFGTPRRGSTSVPDSAPPIPPVPTRFGAGQPGSIYGESSFLSSSQLYVPPLPYPAGPSLGVPPLPQTHHYGSAQVDACGYHTPTQPGFPDAPGNPPYSFPPSLGFSEELGVPSHLGAARPATPGSSYRGPSYPGRPSYPGQQGMTEMPSPGNSFNATPLGPPQSAPSFPSAQPESGYGTTGYSEYGQGSYQPEY